MNCWSINGNVIMAQVCSVIWHKFYNEVAVFDCLDTDTKLLVANGFARPSGRGFEFIFASCGAGNFIELQLADCSFLSGLGHVFTLFPIYSCWILELSILRPFIGEDLEE